MKSGFGLEKRVTRYAFAVGATLVCLVITIWIHQRFGFLTFQFSILAVVLSAWYGGLGPGLLTGTLLSAATAYLLEPMYSFEVNRLEDLLRLGVFVLVSILMSVLSETRRKAEHALAARTVELEAANRELDAFSHSVSHDLRSPLRLIDNHARVALEEPSIAAPVEGSLRAIRGTTQQMGQLVDDLLAFSRLGRQPVLRRPTEPGDLVRAALKDLEAEQKDRTIEVCILDLPHCEADPALLKVVFANLLQNALKFTRQRENARIEVGAQPSTDGPIYYIKDNGVGFDMQFTQQLFGMFQRLHRDEDIEGTGVGLATVRRIIDRHGGRIWAEAEVGKGAAFYFTLGHKVTT